MPLVDRIEKTAQAFADFSCLGTYDPVCKWIKRHFAVTQADALEIARAAMERVKERTLQRDVMQADIGPAFDQRINRRLKLNSRQIRTKMVAGS